MKFWTSLLIAPVSAPTVRLTGLAPEACWPTRFSVMPVNTSLTVLESRVTPTPSTVIWASRAELA